MSKIYDALKKRDSEAVPAVPTDQQAAGPAKESDAEKEAPATLVNELPASGTLGTLHDDLVLAASENEAPPNEVPPNVFISTDGDATPPASPGDAGGGTIRRLSLPSLLIDRMPDFLQEMAGLYRNLFILRKGELGTIMLCGIESGVGTTMVAMNLASYVVRQEGKPILLIDANFRNPSLFRYQDQFKHAGFHELITEHGPLKNYVLPTNIPKLAAMNAGKVTSRTGESFNSRGVDYAVSECRAMYPVVVIDAPPVGSGHDSLDLAKSVDGVILVVRSSSSADDVRKAKIALENAQAHIVGVIFNRH